MTKYALTVEEVAQATPFSIETVRGFIKSGQLAAHKTTPQSRKYLILPEDLDRFLISLPPAHE